MAKNKKRLKWQRSQLQVVRAWLCFWRFLQFILQFNNCCGRGDLITIHRCRRLNYVNVKSPCRLFPVSTASTIICGLSDLSGPYMQYVCAHNKSLSFSLLVKLCKFQVWASKSAMSKRKAGREIGRDF